MNKLELQARVLLTELSNPELSEVQKPVVVELALRSFAADLLTQLMYFKEKAIPPEVIKELISQAGLDLDLRTNKFK